jgi:hypothetical protein
VYSEPPKPASLSQFTISAAKRTQLELSIIVKVALRNDNFLQEIQKGYSQQRLPDWSKRARPRPRNTVTT